MIEALNNKYNDNLTSLKSKLIDLAIQGKLTEQLPEDGTAEELETGGRSSMALSLQT